MTLALQKKSCDIVLEEQMKKDEEVARALQDKLWNDGEPQVSIHLPGDAAQYQIGASDEQTDTGSSTWEVPLAVVFSEINNANASGQTPIVQAEEKQLRVPIERPKPFFKRILEIICNNVFEIYTEISRGLVRLHYTQ
jgi:hypothetical protein